MILYPKIVENTEGKLVQIPGLPVMYDYEFFPQKVVAYSRSFSEKCLYSMENDQYFL